VNPTEEFEATELRQARIQFDYEYTCNLCEYSFGSDMQPDQLRRMLNHPVLEFTITDNSGDQNDGESEPDDDQHSIDDFS